MRARPTCHLLRSGSVVRTTRRSRAWWTSACSNTLSSTGFTRQALRADVAAITRRARRQAGCMAKAEKSKASKVTKPRKKTSARLTRELDLAMGAAEDKKAENLVLLDLRKAAGFTAVSYTHLTLPTI